MSINSQYTFDKQGNPIGVFLSIDEWNHLAEELHLEIPQWQKDLLDLRLEEYKRNPGNTLDWEEVSKDLGS